MIQEEELMGFGAELLAHMKQEMDQDGDVESHLLVFKGEEVAELPLGTPLTKPLLFPVMMRIMHAEACCICTQATYTGMDKDGKKKDPPEECLVVHGFSETFDFALICPFKMLKNGSTKVEWGRPFRLREGQFADGYGPEQFKIAHEIGEDRPSAS